MLCEVELCLVLTLFTLVICFFSSCVCQKCLRQKAQAWQGHARSSASPLIHTEGATIHNSVMLHRDDLRTAFRFLKAFLALLSLLRTVHARLLSDTTHHLMVMSKSVCHTTVPDCELGPSTDVASKDSPDVVLLWLTGLKPPTN